MSIQNNALDQYEQRAISVLLPRGVFIDHTGATTWQCLNQIIATVISFPTLESISTGTFDLSGAVYLDIGTSLNTIESGCALVLSDTPDYDVEGILSSLVTLNGTLTISGNNITSFFLPLLTTFGPGAYLILSNNALTNTSIASTFTMILGCTPAGGTVDVSGGTNASPTGLALVKYQALVDGGVTVTTNAIQQILVNGAGEGTVNAAYDYAGILDNRPRYSTVDRSIAWVEASTRWEIGDGASLIYYVSTDDVMSPDLVTTWVVGPDGTLPVPAVTLG